MSHPTDLVRALAASPERLFELLERVPFGVVGLAACAVGAVFDLAITAGARRLRVRAPGYETFDTTIVIPAGGTVSLGRVALRTRGGGT